MKLQNVTSDQLRTCVNFISVNNYDGELIFDRKPEWRGNWLHFTLRTVNGRSLGARRTHRGRRLAKACWHAHRDVMKELFNTYPSALLVTMLARYDGRDGFLAEFPATGNNNVGSMVQPLLLREACDC